LHQLRLEIEEQFYCLVVIQRGTDAWGQIVYLFCGLQEQSNHRDEVVDHS